MVKNLVEIVFYLGIHEIAWIGTFIIYKLIKAKCTKIDIDAINCAFNTFTITIIFLTLLKMIKFALILKGYK